MSRLPIPAPERHEGVKHGQSFFPVEKYATFLDEKMPARTNHWHEEAEWTLVTAGQGTYQVDLVEYPIQAGDFLFVPPLQLHAARCSRELETETFVFHMNFLGSNATDICATRYLAPLAKQELSIPCHIGASHPAYPALSRLFTQLNELFMQKSPGYELALKACLLQAVSQLFPYGQTAPSSDSATISQKLKHVLDYLAAHYTEEISVAQLAGLCYFSEYHFMRFFKKHMNMTCVEYITSLRLEKAVEQLVRGDSTILDAALSSGFHSLAYFYKVFKRKYQMTPKEFIKQLQTPFQDGGADRQCETNGLY